MYYHYLKCFIFKNYLLLFGFIFLLLISISACNGKSKQNSETSKTSEKSDSNNVKTIRNVTFLPYWVTAAQFAGYYVAEDMGIYKKYGIKLNIIPYQPFSPTENLIKNGKVDFAALWLVNAIELKASGVDIVNIAQPSTRSSLMLVTKKKEWD